MEARVDPRQGPMAGGGGGPVWSALFVVDAPFFAASAVFAIVGTYS